MKPIKVPDRYNYVAAFFTLDCNLSCDYCLNKDSGLVEERNEMTAEQWIEGLNRLKIRDDLPITLEGGEPTIHRGFYNIVEKTNHPIDMLTNLQFDIDKFIKKVNKDWFNKRSNPAYKSIRGSFHSGQMNLEHTIKKAEKLQHSGFEVGLFALNLPEAIEENMKMAELARQHQVYFFIKDYLGKRDGRLFGHYKYPEALDGIKKDALCRIKELLISPEGNIYRCHRDLYHAENPIGHLLDKNFQIEDIFRPCENYGTCNPCDVKSKVNRFLNRGHCSVEIKNG